MSTLNAFLRIFTEGRLPSVEVKTWNSFTIQIQVRQTTGPKSLDKRCLKTMERGKTNELFALLIFHHSALVELHNGPQSTVPALPKKYEPTWKQGPRGLTPLGAGPCLEAEPLGFLLPLLPNRALQHLPRLLLVIGAQNRSHLPSLVVKSPGSQAQGAL